MNLSRKREAPVRSVDFEVVETVGNQVLRKPQSGVEGEAPPALPVEGALPAPLDDEELTVVESSQEGKERLHPSPIYVFFHFPYHEFPLSTILTRYFHNVRLRMIESRQHDQLYYPNALFEKFRRLVLMIFLRRAANLHN